MDKEHNINQVASDERKGMSSSFIKGYVIGMIAGVAIWVSIEALFYAFILTLFGLSFNFAQGLGIALVVELITSRFKLNNG